MFKRLKPLFIGTREITCPLAIYLSQYVTEERALFIAELRVNREYTFRMVAEECSRAWEKDWGDRQDIGDALCRLSAAHLGEEWDYLDTL